MNVLILIAAQAGALGIFLALTHHPDFRGGRWGKIIGSMPFVAAVTWYLTRSLAGNIGSDLPGLLCFIFSSAMLAFIWCGKIAKWWAHGYINFFYRDIHSITGQRPDFKFACNHRRDGEMAEAIKAAKHELEKDAKNFEGLLLLGQIYQDQNNPKEAMPHLQLILNNPALSDEQRAMARNEMDNCKRLTALRDIEEINRKSHA